MQIPVLSNLTIQIYLSGKPIQKSNKATPSIRSNQTVPYKIKKPGQNARACVLKNT